MSSIDSLSEIVLGNLKIPSESEANIVPFLECIKKSHGTPLALIHDMGKGILAAVGKVFPGVPDFICHFHFLRDIGKDFSSAANTTSFASGCATTASARSCSARRNSSKPKSTATRR